MARKPRTGLHLPGRVGNYASVPSSELLNSSGGQTIILRLAFNEWPLKSSATLISKYGTGGNQRMWRIDAAASGAFAFLVSLDGSAVSTAASSTAALNVIKAGVPIYIRCTRVQSTGSTQFSYSSDGVSYTNMGSPAVIATGPLFATSTAPLVMGSFDTGVQQNPNITLYNAYIRYGTTNVLNVDFTKQTPGATSFTEDAAGTTVTVNQSGSLQAAIVGRSVVSRRVPPVGLYIPGTFSNFASSPDAVILDVTGDIEIVARYNPYNIVNGSFWPILNKRNTSDGLQAAYMLRHAVSSRGLLEFVWYSSGSPQSYPSTATLPYNTGVPRWVKATFDVNNGAGGADIKFWYAPDQEDEPTSWTQLGSTVVIGSTQSIDATTGPLNIGQGSTNQVGVGMVYRTIVRNGIDGTTVFDADFTKHQGKTSFTEDAAGATVSLTKTGADSARIVGRTFSNALSLYGPSGNYASTPDAAPLDISGDYDWRILMSVPTTTPSSDSVIFSKWLATGNQRSYSLRWLSAGALSSSITTDGSASIAATASAATPFIPNVPKWIRITRSGSTVTFYTSDEIHTKNPTDWTQLGTTGTQAGTIYSGTGNLTMGIFSDATSQPIRANIYYISIANSASGAPVFVADFTKQPAGTTSFADDANGATITVNTSGSYAAAIKGRVAP